MVSEGWTVVAADGPGRDVADVLAGPATREMRERDRRERAEAERRLARAQADRDAAEAAGWMAGLRGETVPTAGDVVGRGLQDDRGRGEGRELRDFLRSHGRMDLLPGGGSLTLFDANVGVLEPGGRGSLSRSASELDDPQLRRSIQRAAEAAPYMRRAAARRRSEIARAAQQAVSAAVPSGRHGPGSGCQVCEQVYSASPIPPWQRTS